MKRRVLWVGDDVYFDLAPLAGPVYMNVGYDLVVAGDVSLAIGDIRTRGPFDAVIVDIRLLPGHDPKWWGLYNSEGRSRIGARLGMHLLHSLLGHQGARITLENRPSWLTPNVLGVFTAENREEVEEELERLEIQVYQQKEANIPPTILLEIIERILQQQS